MVFRTRGILVLVGARFNVERGEWRTLGLWSVGCGLN